MGRVRRSLMCTHRAKTGGLPRRVAMPGARRAYRALALSLALAASGMLPPAPEISAQTPEDEVRAVVDALFDAMRAKDEATLRSLFLPEARLFNTSIRDGAPTIRFRPIAEFIEAVVTSPEYLDERIWDVEVRADGTLAAVWNRYNFYRGDVLDHCGVDAFQLFRSSDGWKIFHVADTLVREGCTGPGP